MNDTPPMNVPMNPTGEVPATITKPSPVVTMEEKGGWYKRARYKESANLISAVALVFALVAIWQTHSEHKNHDLENLQQVAVEIVENQKALNEQPVNQADAVAASNIQSFLIQKGNTLASRGIELSKNYADNTSPEVLMVIGYQAAASGHYLEAEDLYKKAMDKSDSPLAKSGPQLALARLYFTQGNPHFSTDRGGQLYRDALTGMKDLKDPAIVYETGYLYETWAASEFQNQNAADGLGKLAESERVYLTLPLWNGNRAIALQRLSQTRSRFVQTSAPGQELAKGIAGNWVSVGPTEGSLTGKMSISLDRDSGQLSATFLEKLNGLDSLGPGVQVAGPVIMHESHTAVFSWQGSNGLKSITGTTNFTFSPNLSSISAEEIRPGQPSLKYTLVRPK